MGKTQAAELEPGEADEALKEKELKDIHEQTTIKTHTQKNPRYGQEGQDEEGAERNGEDHAQQQQQQQQQRALVTNLRAHVHLHLGFRLLPSAVACRFFGAILCAARSPGLLLRRARAQVDDAKIGIVSK